MFFLSNDAVVEKLDCKKSQGEFIREIQKKLEEFKRSDLNALLARRLGLSYQPIIFSEIDPKNSDKQEQYNIDKMIQEIVNRESIGNEEKEEKMNIYRGFAELLSHTELFKKEGSQHYRLGIYGSFINGTAKKNSDIDFTILTDSYVDEAHLLRQIHDELSELINPVSSHLELITETKIPLIKFRLPSVVQPGEKIEMEVTVNNLLGVMNSQLLKTYMELHWKVKTLGSFIKIWSKSKQVQIQSLESMTSYSLILLMIDYLQLKGFIPCLQEELSSKSPKQNHLTKIKRKNVKKSDVYESFETNFWFESDPNIIRECMQQKGYLEKLETTSLEDLFKEFLNYCNSYTKEYQKINITTLDKKNHRIEKSEQLFDIVDPFDHKHNPGDRPKEGSRVGILKLVLENQEALFKKDKIKFMNQISQK